MALLRALAFLFDTVYTDYAQIWYPLIFEFQPILYFSQFAVFSWVDDLIYWLTNVLNFPFNLILEATTAEFALVYGAYMIVAFGAFWLLMSVIKKLSPFA